MKIFLILQFLLVFLVSNTAYGSGNAEPVSQNAAGVLPDANAFSPSLREQYEAGRFIIAQSSADALTVTGLSNPMSKRDDEIASAKEDAALKIAMYFGIQGKIESVSGRGSGFLDYQDDSNTALVHDTDYEKYMERLTFDPQTDVLITREGVFVRFQYPAAVTGINYSARLSDGRPQWLNAGGVPRIAGFITAVGFSRNQRRLKDTIIKSTQNAAIRMIEGLSTTVNTREASAAGQGSSSIIHSVSEGALYGFQVIEFWIEPQTRYVYTLAAARAGD